MGMPIFRTTPNGLTEGQNSELQCDSQGSLRTVLRFPNTNANVSGINANSDAVAATSGALVVGSMGYLFNGTSWDRQRTPAVFKSLASTAIGTEATVWTPTAGKKFRLLGFTVAASTAISVVLKDNTAGTTIFTIPTLVIGTPYTISLGNGILSAAANNVLTATGSGAGNLIGTFFGTEE